MNEIFATKTERGFSRFEFADRYDVECSLQASSLATESAIWLGCTSPNLRHCVRGKGWVPYELPEGIDVQADTRMHLTQDLVKELMPFLAHFAKHGELPEIEDGIPMTQKNRWRLAAYEWRFGWRTVGLGIVSFLLGTAFASLQNAFAQVQAGF